MKYDKRRVAALRAAMVATRRQKHAEIRQIDAALNTLSSELREAKTSATAAEALERAKVTFSGLR
jgi:hypothetical protein